MFDVTFLLLKLRELIVSEGSLIGKCATVVIVVLSVLHSCIGIGEPLSESHVA